MIFFKDLTKLLLAERVYITRTSAFSVADATQEDVDEPLEGVLVHRIDVGHVRHTEEQDLGVYRHRDVLATGRVNRLLCLLSH